MNIVIVGAGFTGIELAKRLINEKNNVTLIDNNEETVRHASNRLDCTVLSADGNNLETLEEVGIAKADAIVALTESDEINMITCSLVDAVYPDILKIARVRNYAYYLNSENATRTHKESFGKNKRPLYGIDFMIHPDVEAAQAIVKAVEHGAVTNVITLGRGEYELTTLKIEEKSRADGVSLKDLRTLVDCAFIVVFVETKDGSMLPFGDTVLHSGDKIGILTVRENVGQMMELVGTKSGALKKIAIVGAGKIGTIVADSLFAGGKLSFLKKIFDKNRRSLVHDIAIIDSNDALCNAAISRYPGAKVFCADVTDETFLKEEGIENYDLLVATTPNHELNMISAAYIESIGVKRTIALVSHSAFADIARKLGIEVPIPMRDTVVDSIMSHLRGKLVTGVHTVSDGKFEIVSCDIFASGKMTGKQLKDIASPGEFLILLIRKKGGKKYELPSGTSVLETGDHIVLIERTGDKKILEKFSGAS